MRNYKITDDLRKGINEYLGIEYILPNEVGHKIDHLENYETIAKIAPDKAKLLMATLFPEDLKDQTYLSAHRDEIVGLASRLHVEKKGLGRFSWTQFMVRREVFPPALEGKKDEDIFKGNIVRFR